MGSFAPNAVIKTCTKLHPMIPVSATAAAVSSSGADNLSAIGSASASVAPLGTKARARSTGRPAIRARHAVESNENAAAEDVVPIKEIVVDQFYKDDD